MRKVKLFIATSVDGYIAKPNNDLSFLSMVDQPGEDYGYAAFEKETDTIIMGRKTYDWVMQQVGVFPHAHKKTYVITRNKRPDSGNITFYNQSLKVLIQTLKQEKGQTIFVDGGAEIIHELLKEKLIDEMIISIIPIILGDGTMLFKKGFPEQKLKMINSITYESGLVQLHYAKI